MGRELAEQLHITKVEGSIAGRMALLAARCGLERSNPPRSGRFVQAETVQNVLPRSRASSE
jgi:hypothetical protein